MRPTGWASQPGEAMAPPVSPPWTGWPADPVLRTGPTVMHGLLDMEAVRLERSP